MQNLKHALDAASFLTAAAVLAKILPPIAALMSIIWLGIQIYEWYKKKTDTK